jgi:prevent-host-death family protein
MKPLHLSEDIVPIKDLETQAPRVLKQLRDSHRPVVITQNGRAAAVLISPEDFDRLRERDRFMAAVQEGLADVEAGRLLDTQEVDRELDLELGPLTP